MNTKRRYPRWGLGLTFYWKRFLFGVQWNAWVNPIGKSHAARDYTLWIYFGPLTLTLSLARKVRVKRRAKR